MDTDENKAEFPFSMMKIGKAIEKKPKNVGSG